MLTTAILVAAGPGSRLQPGLPKDQVGLPKAFVPLAGCPLLVYSLRVFEACSSISRVVVVTPPGRAKEAERTARQEGPWRFDLALTEGGAERQDSVRAGLARLADAELVGIHDAARPLVSPILVEKVIAAAVEHGAAIPAIPAVDTVKLCDESGFVEQTVSRQRVWLAQTPQVFRADWIRRAHEAARERGSAATDDAMLVEQLGLRVHLVRGEPTNRKITTPEDREWAEWWLSKAGR